MASGGLIIVNPIIDIDLVPMLDFQRETKVKVRAVIVNMFSKKAQVQWEIYPTSAPKEKVILPVKTVVAANGSKQLEKVFEGLNPNTEYTIVARVTNLSEISGGTAVGEYWKTARAKTLIMSRNLQAYRIGTGNVTARLINLTKYPYDRQVKFFYKKKGEKKYKLSKTVALPEGENGNIIHLYSSLQQNTEYIFYVEVYRTDKNKRISYLSMTKKTKVYIPGGLPDPHLGNVVTVPTANYAKTQVLWDGDLPEDTFVVMQIQTLVGSLPLYDYVRDKNNNVIKLKKPGNYLMFRSNFIPNQIYLSVARMVNGSITLVKTSDSENVDFRVLPIDGVATSTEIYPIATLDFADAFVSLHDFLAIDQDVSDADEIYNAFLEKKAAIETGNPVESSLFDYMVQMANLWLGANIEEWGDRSGEPLDYVELNALCSEIRSAFGNWSYEQ